MPNSHEFLHSQPMMGICIGPKNIKTGKNLIFLPILRSKTDLLGISGAIDIPQKWRILSISMTFEKKFQKCAGPSHRKTIWKASPESFKAIRNFLVITRAPPNLDVEHDHILSSSKNRPEGVQYLYQNA